MSSSKSVRVKTRELPVGSRLGHPINDDEDRLLLAAGALLTSAIKERLRKRGINEVLLHPDDAAALLGKKKATAERLPPRRSPPIPPPRSPRQAPPLAQPDFRSRPPPAAAELELRANSLAASVSLQIKNTASPLSQKVAPQGCVPYSLEQRQRLEQNFSKTTELLDDMIGQALAGGLRDHRPLAKTAENYVTELCDDADHVIASSTEMAPDPKVTERSVRLALFAMATDTNAS